MCNRMVENVQPDKTGENALKFFIHHVLTPYYEFQLRNLLNPVDEGNGILGIWIFQSTFL